MEIDKLDEIMIVFVILDNTDPGRYLLYNGWRTPRVLIALDEFAIKLQAHE